MTKICATNVICIDISADIDIIIYVRSFAIPLARY